MGLDRREGLWAVRRLPDDEPLPLFQAARARELGVEAAANLLTTILYWVLPNLSPFDVRAAVVHGQPVPVAYMVLSAGYAALYITGLIVAAAAVFARRDFK